MAKRPITPGYIFFYILFSPDTYRLLTAVLLAWLLAPHLVASREMSPLAGVVVWIMVGGIGYGFSGRPARGIADFLRRKILGNRS